MKNEDIDPRLMVSNNEVPIFSSQFFQPVYLPLCASTNALINIIDADPRGGACVE
ncbi:hypothetical protein ALT785_470024 [Alteromonas infernus]